ncbi:unnamed protein product, partial [Lymnaea stagnalis]
ATTIIFYIVFDRKFRTEFFKVVNVCKKLCRRKKQVILDEILDPSRRISRFTQESQSRRVSRFSQSSKKFNQIVEQRVSTQPANDAGVSSIDPTNESKRDLPKPTSDSFFFF